ncbi:Rhs element Vgr protein [Paraburkholderia piptadeniae]|uniref:Rhs element Vgr protein n=1 Tax=Paraburkholderia piptadeniae TaxID=1701573 RepID=A0A1N7ST04_9BURK|nr:type VI secretion system Vgr family protein [Paraburkholderia piptadeniae]SIT50601.1 Rhs element Vgr protein [Paraburkholderia piptadeniae]
MSWFKQPRTLEITSEALPQWAGEPLFVVSRLSGREKLGHLYEYDVEVSTRYDETLTATEAQALVDVDALIGKEVTVRIAIEGNGTWEQGKTGGAAANFGADVRKLTGLIVCAQCVGADDRRAFYRLKLRPWLWLATLNRDSRLWMNRDIIEITRDVLQKYPYPFEMRLAGPGVRRRPYPRREYQRQWWESDFSYLNRLWQEWGITFFYDGSTLVLCDSPGAYKKHPPAYETLRFLDRDGQRIDEEHVHAFRVARQITTGQVTLVDYDYTQSLAKLTHTQSDHSKRAFDNAEEYAWGDYSQPGEGPMGTDPAWRSDPEFDGRHLARVKVEAHRAKSLRAKGKGNLRGLMTGYTFTLEDYPLTPGDGEYLVVSTKTEIVSNDTVTQHGGIDRLYSCTTTFAAVPASTFYRTPQKAQKPRAYAETAIVTGYGEEPVYDDHLGRVKVHFIWDRLGPKNENSSCWLRVASPWHGVEHGAMWMPRTGHHVLVGYYDSDPDRPYVISGHMTEFHKGPWKLPKNDALSGWRSQELGGESANSVMTDDTPGKLQVQVASDHAQSRLVLGHNTRIDGHNGRDLARGEGFELATEAHGVLRANRGLLVTTETRAGALSPVKDMGETVQRLTQAREQHEDLAQLAQRHKAQSAEANQHDATGTIKTQNDAIRGRAKSRDDPSPEMTRPDLLVASSAGIAMTAADGTHMASYHDHAITAGRDVSVSSGRSFLASVRGAISMFAYQLGLKLIAAKGKVEVQAQSDEMALAALKDVTVSSTDGRVVITASKEVWIGAGGSYIQINGSGIINGSPGPILEKTPSWDVPGASSVRAPLPVLPLTPLAQNPAEIYSQTFDVSTVAENRGIGPKLADQPYRVYLPDGTIQQQGMLTEGSTLTVSTSTSTKVKCEIGAGDWSVAEDAYDRHELTVDDDAGA